tara:strand:+ start:197 stop:574 length:378 start_codon:yes stop_codon:yes gene_type:complete
MEFHVSDEATNINPANVSNIAKVGDSSQISNSSHIYCDKFALCLKTSFTDNHKFYLFAFHNQVDPETHSIIRKHAVFEVEYGKFSVNPEVEFSLQQNYTGDPVDIPIAEPYLVSQIRFTNMATLA